LTAIREQAVRMALLADNLLDMAKLQAGGVRCARTGSRWKNWSDRPCGCWNSRLRDHPSAAALDPELPLINCDAVLIERVLVNLLENATKYTPAGTAIGVTAVAEVPTG
jgi:two-component system sensor histidine kinase KdpD